ncbi:hypothetical protein KV097_18600 [Mumia sp. zg.B17]|uniref:hypothetical protein n=1 Tax=Mumia sp. zg.B17 TaxID=2855446 RepID=UPI001C6DF91F|nr:hypothetical protein [Mumia sp. zg.B17]MBW9207953.1 hypothetical protein [Mumia sp. zg.B17]
MRRWLSRTADSAGTFGSTAKRSRNGSTHAGRIDRGHRDALTAVAGLALTGVLALTGCGAQDEASPSLAPSSSTPGAPDLEQFTPPPSGLVDEDTGESVEPRPVPEWDDASRAAVVKAAETALRAFARPTLDHQTWWTQLEPLLTPQAAADYSYVDPANIPALKVTGPGLIVLDTSAYVATVEIPTSVARYQLILTRKDAGAPWLTSRITPVGN